MKNPFGIVALVMGSIAMVTFWFLESKNFHRLYAIIPFAILAIIFGGIGINKDYSKTMATIGLLLGVIVILLGILFYLFLPPFLPLHYLSILNQFFLFMICFNYFSQLSILFF